ncbi:MAG TPA: hypothetical protein VM639_12780 [Dongiaceae bacterium]|nr:hypothetical protein [Dongiaceae bacterium]
MNPKDEIKKLEEHFGSRECMLANTLIQLSLFGQPCDVTFYKRRPIIDVQVDQQLGLAMMYGAGPAKVADLLNNIKFSDGTRAGLAEIWTVNPMPKEGFTKAELDAVDLAQGDQVAGMNGETIRQIVRETYHCETAEEEDRHLRRFIAS